MPRVGRQLGGRVGGGRDGGVTDFADRVMEDIAYVSRAKAEMIERGRREDERLCPRCGGTVRIVLAGDGNDVHAACENVGCLLVIE